MEDANSNISAMVHTVQNLLSVSFTDCLLSLQNKGYSLVYYDME